MLAGSRPTENYLSRAFQACFTQSSVFANATLKLLWKSLNLRKPTPDAEGWICEYQPPAPHVRSIRPDICLRPPHASGRLTKYKPIFLESKVGAVLGEQQLRRYKESGVEVLVAITKNWPEVPKKRLRDMGVKHLRWQEVSRALSELTGHKGKDRFLCDSFIEYLEYSGMSYREYISITQLEKMRELLERIGTPGFAKGTVPRSGFSYIDSCLYLLKDARRMAQERIPTLARCKTWGPGYWNLCSDDNEIITYHSLGMAMYPGAYSKNRILCAIDFPTEADKKIRWRVANYGTETEDMEISRPIKEFTTKGKLDAGKLATSIEKEFNRWKPF
jgi:hypothetical protein